MMSVTKSTQFMDGHYYMRLPLKDEDAEQLGCSRIVSQDPSEKALKVF